MLYKLIQWFKRNACKECDYYHPENNVCQSKKCATCGCHPYVNWLDRHFCEPHKTEVGNKMMQIAINIPEEIYKASQIIDAKYEDVIQIPLEVIKNGIPLSKGHDRKFEKK